MRTKHLKLDNLGRATAVLADAFRSRPPATSLFREPDADAKLVYFMECSARYALLYGECQATEDESGVALWLLPGATRMTPLRMFRARMFAAPLRLGLRDFRAFGAFAAHTDKVHRAAVPEPHYYLLALGVRPDRQGKGVGGQLLRGMLARADREGAPIYLETQSPENVSLYQRFGFEVASDELIPGLDLRNWGMVRR
jgi:ribosomal protein S18 acetylase RimI-like enzyme